MDLLFTPEEEAFRTEVRTFLKENLSEDVARKGRNSEELTKEEMEMTPGRPTLTVNFSPRRESEGCIIPYSVSMAIKEEVVMVRDTTIKLSGNAWAGSVRENLANRNFTPTSALNEVLQKLEKDFTAANSS